MEKMKTEEYLKSDEFTEYARAYYESKDYIEETLDNISGGYYSEGNYSLLGILIKEALDVYANLAASEQTFRDDCFKRYSKDEATHKVCKKAPEFDKAKTEILKLIYQIYEDNLN